jgi:hypothetical protein
MSRSGRAVVSVRPMTMTRLPWCSWKVPRPVLPQQSMARPKRGSAGYTGLAESALAAGDHAAVRRTESVADLAARYPDDSLIARFDARDVKQLGSTSQTRCSRQVRDAALA